jgi:hypothetical protein
MADIIIGQRGLIDEIKALEIKDDNSYKAAGDFAVQVADQMKGIEDYWKEEISDAHKLHVKLNGKKKNMLKPWEEIQTVLRGKLSTYQAELARKQREEQEKQRKAEEAERARLAEEARKLEEAGDAEAAQEKRDEAEMAPVINVQKEAPKVSGLAFYTDYEITVLDEDAVPVKVGNEVLRPVDEAAIKRAVKAAKGNIEIPGVLVQPVQKPRIG